jgi:hypothetical protein
MGGADDARTKTRARAKATARAKQGERTLQTTLKTAAFWGVLSKARKNDYDTIVVSEGS